MEYKNTLRSEVWDLGQHSAGISIRFCQQFFRNYGKVDRLEDNTMDHMPLTGIKGIDLYAYTDGHWKYVNTGRVKGKTNEFTLVKN